MIAAARWRGSSWLREAWPWGSPGLPGCWRCSCANFAWIEPRHRLQVTSGHPRTTRGRRRPWGRRWPQAVCSRSVSHRWMGCSTAALHRLCQNLTGAALSQTCPEPCCRGLRQWRPLACPTREEGSKGPPHTPPRSAGVEGSGGRHGPAAVAYAGYRRAGRSSAV
jgi:hypothetical protein